MEVFASTAPGEPAAPATSTGSWGRALSRSLLVALLCGALQALQPGYVLAGSAVLPPLSLALGVAAAVALARGAGTLPAAALGVLAGSLLDGESTAQAVLAALAIAAQAAMAAGLMHRGGDAGWMALDTGARIRRLVLRAAPAAAVLGVALEVLGDGLYGSGWPAPRALLAVATGRLVADWAGIVFGTVVLLCWLGWPAHPWRPRRRLLALPLLLLLLPMLAGIHEVARRDESRLAVRFQTSASERLWRVQQLLALPLDTLAALRGALVAADAVGRALPLPVFDRLVDEAARRQSGLAAAGWIDRGPEGQPLPAHWRVSAPPAAADAAPGAAAGPQPDTLPPTLQRAWARVRDAERPVAVPALPEPGREAEPLLYVAQALPAAADRPARLVYLLLRTDALLQPAMPAADDPNLVACLIEPGERTDPAVASAADVPPRRLAGPLACEAGGLGRLARTSTERVTLADRALRLVVAEPAAADDRLLSAVWLLALPAVVGLSALATLLLALSGRLWRIEDRVRERTAALRAEVDERRRAEGELARSEQRFRAIFDSVHLGVTLVDLDGRIAAANPAFCAMMGCEAERLIGRPLDDFRLPDVAEDDGTATALAGTSARRQRFLTPDGRVLQVAASLRTLHDADGQPVGTVGALADLSPVLHLRQAERERDEAAIASRTKGEFLARLSHELRAPLNAIMGFAQMIGAGAGADEGVDPALQRRGLEQIRQAGWHLLDMINDVLDLSRMEAGSLRLTLEPVSLPDVAQEAMAMIEPAAQQAGVTLDMSLSPLAEHVQADPLRLRQILINLLSNAVRYNRAGGRVELRARPGGVGEVAIEVHDTGMGLSTVQLAELFTPFNRLGRDARERAGGDAASGGTGIGLVISRRLAELMGGEITVASTVGEGSVFSLRLPKAQGVPERVEVSAGAALPSAVAIGAVLYIEDRDSDVAVMRGLLAARPGVTLRTAPTGEAGLAAAPEADLVLLDLDLPGRPGLAVLRALRADARTRLTPVIVVSGDSSPARIDECFEAGATDYLTKPLEAAALLRAVDSALKAA